MIYYFMALLEAAVVVVPQLMFWHCYRANSYTWAQAAQWKHHKRLGLISFAAQLIGLLLLAWAAQATGIGAGYFRRILLLPFLWTAVLTDWKDQVIPNRLLAVALVGRAVLLALEIALSPDLALALLLFVTGGMLLTGIIMLLCYLITRRALGEGDVKLMIVVGAFCGANNAINILVVSMVLLALLCIAALIFRKASLKSVVPMAPAFWCGFLLFYVLDVLGG